MNHESLMDMVRESSAVWNDLKRRWHELGLPGSAFSPEPFIACLLLSRMGNPDSDSVALRVKSASRLLDEVKRRTSLYGTDLNTAIALTLVQSDAVDTAPLVVVDVPAQEEVQVTTECPHCGHDFAECGAGNYHTAVPDEEEPLAKEISGQEIEETSELEEPGCCHVGTDGKCVECTEESIAICHGCNEAVVESKGQACKNDCENIYCDSCAESELSEYGYCSDCRELTCDSNDCQGTIEAGTEHRCASEECSREWDICDDCAPSYFNEKGLCPECSEEEEHECVNCSRSVTDSRAVKCKENCGNVYCLECKDQINDLGYCSDCETLECFQCEGSVNRGEEILCKNCGKKFCPDCAPDFLSDGQCYICSGEEVLACSACRGYFTESKLLKCKNFEECGQSYCSECKELRINEEGICKACLTPRPKPEPVFHVPVQTPEASAEPPQKKKWWERW